MHSVAYMLGPSGQAYSQGVHPKAQSRRPSAYSTVPSGEGVS